MVILRTRNKITDFLMILAWASPFMGQRRYVKMGPDKLKGDEDELKGYRMALEGDEEALINNGGMLVYDREAIKIE